MAFEKRHDLNPPAKASEAHGLAGLLAYGGTTGVAFPSPHRGDSGTRHPFHSQLRGSFRV